METMKINALEKFKSCEVTVMIHGEEGEETPPPRKKNIRKLERCSQDTHLRIYFDEFCFVAVPLTSKVKWTENEWTAYDKASGLYYVVKRES